MAGSIDNPPAVHSWRADSRMTSPTERARCEQLLRQALAAAGNTKFRHRINRIAELCQESACQKSGDPVGPCKK